MMAEFDPTEDLDLLVDPDGAADSEVSLHLPAGAGPAELAAAVVQAGKDDPGLADLDVIVDGRRRGVVFVRAFGATLVNHRGEPRGDEPAPVSVSVPVRLMRLSAHHCPNCSVRALVVDPTPAPSCPLHGPMRPAGR
jgi:hypothetical protein